MLGEIQHALFFRIIDKIFFKLYPINNHKRILVLIERRNEDVYS